MFNMKGTKKKGVTPVIAIVLLLMMTVAAAGLAMEFIGSMNQDMIDTVDAEYKDTSRKINTDVRVMQIKNGSASDELIFRMKNYGSIPFPHVESNIIAVFVDGEYVPGVDVLANHGCTDATNDNSTQPGAICELVINGTNMNLPPEGVTKTFSIEFGTNNPITYGCYREQAAKDFC